jgi:magnesium transporter
MAKRKSPVRRRKRKSTRGPVGAPPGTLTIHPDALPSRASVITYDTAEVTEQVLSDLGVLTKMRERHRVTWVDTVGLGGEALIRGLGDALELHPLALEDVVHTHQRAKLDAYPGTLFLVLNMPSLREDALDLEQISIFIAKDFVATFQEREGDCFEPVRNRIRQARGRLRTSGPDYLGYALLDAVVDSYFPLLERYGERLEELEDRVLEDPTAALVSEVHAIKRELASIRRAVWPLREAVSMLLRDESPLITADTRLYLRDAYDHTIQVVELVESQREVASGLLDVYLSSVSNRMNEVMKVLTIIATIFIPLGFVAGLYGMNFDTSVSPWNMPELSWPWGYPAALAIMASIAIGMLTYFRRKRWI